MAFRSMAFSRLNTRTALLLGALVWMAVAWAGPTPAAAQEPANVLPPTDTPEFLRPGDVVRVQVWRQEEFSGEFFITDDGRIAHPLYRRIYAVRRPVSEVEDSIRLFLSEFEAEPNFVIEGFFQVAVGGQVRQPDIHTLRPGTTVVEAVARAGGVTEQGSLDRVILRRDAAEYRLDLTDTSGEARRLTIRSGDELVVERRRSTFRDYVLPAISVAGSIASIVRLGRGR
ncbi:MAG: hypothetical protein EA422_13405 [Gemmatimonadales bacterium]|nr:MAG: hypothetical protein EA422_13405 [Gemmatimonadales bacterium]